MKSIRCANEKCYECDFCKDDTKAQHQRELLSERERVVEECCRAVCAYCSGGDVAWLFQDKWIHGVPFSESHFCRADPIRRLSTKGEGKDIHIGRVVVSQSAATFECEICHFKAAGPVGNPNFYCKCGGKMRMT